MNYTLMTACSETPLILIIPGRSISFMHVRVTVLAALIQVCLGASCSVLPRLISTHLGAPSWTLDGTGLIDESGNLQVLVTTIECQRKVVETYCEDQGMEKCLEREEKVRTEPATCPEDITTLTVTAPWGANVTAPLHGQRTVTFAIDWRAAKLDPRAHDTRQQLLKPWVIGSATQQYAQWSPSERDVDAMLAAMMAEISPQAGQPAALMVKELSIASGALTRGSQNRLQLVLANEGTEPAESVVARTSSSDPHLHGIKLEIGRIEGGKTLRRDIDVSLPPGNEDQGTVMIVVVVESANTTEVSYDKRFPIRPPAPALRLQCRIAGNSGTPPQLLAGQEANMECDVENLGSGSIKDVSVIVELGTSRAQAIIAKPIAQKQRSTTRVSINVPADSKPGATLVFRISAGAPGMDTPVTLELSARVGKPQRCPKLLTRAEYEKKDAKYQNLLRSGALNQTEYDRYQAALLRCTK